MLGAIGDNGHLVRVLVMLVYRADPDDVEFLASVYNVQEILPSIEDVQLNYVQVHKLNFKATFTDLGNLMRMFSIFLLPCLFYFTFGPKSFVHR